MAEDRASHPLNRLGRFLSPHPGKRATERFWLLYTPVWGGISGIVMLGGFAERWGDLECLVFGVLLALGAVIGPIVVRPKEERDLPIHQTAGFKLSLSVFGLAFGLNYTQTPFFWDVLHMHYGFNTTVNIANNPLFLYFVSVAYFSTYCALCCICFRMLRALFGRYKKVATLLAFAIAPFLMAFLETALNANPFLESLFCYDDLPFMLWFGTIAYGVAFVYALPMWLAIDERPGMRTRAIMVVVWLFAALYADLMTLDLLRYHVAPHFTTVEPGANGLRDFDDSCLVRPSTSAS